MEATRAVIDWAAIVERFEGDVDLFREVVRLFVRDYPKRLSVMYDALACNDRRTLELVAHSLKGAVANFGAAQAMGAVRYLEELAPAGGLELLRAQCVAVEGEVVRLVAALEAGGEVAPGATRAPCVE